MIIHLAIWDLKQKLVNGKKEKVIVCYGYTEE